MQATDAETVGGRILRAREARGVSRSELARRMDTSRVQVWRVEQDKLDPSVDTVRRIAEALDVDLCWLLDGRRRGLRRRWTPDAKFREVG